MRAPLLLIAFLSVSSHLPAADWPQWRGPDENLISKEKGWAPEIEGVVWQARVGIGFSSIAVADGKAYTMGHLEGQEVIWCLDAAKGDTVWKLAYPAQLLPNLHEGGPASTPTVSGGRVYTLGKDGKAHCLDAATGGVHWQVELLALTGMRNPPEWGFSSSPYLWKDWVVVEADATVALEKATGKLAWKGEVYRPAYGSPALMKDGANEYLLTLKSDGLVAMDATGKTVAFQPWETSFDTNGTTPLVSGNRVFVSTGYDRGCGLFELQGGQFTRVYEKKTMSNHMNNSVLIDGFLYGFDGTAHRGPATQLACVQFETGKVGWRQPGLGCGSLIGVDGHLFILSEKGEFMIAKATPDGIEPIVREQILRGRCWTPPAFANGKIYARNAQGEMVCVALAKVTQ